MDVDEAQLEGDDVVVPEIEDINPEVEELEDIEEVEDSEEEADTEESEEAETEEESESEDIFLEYIDDEESEEDNSTIGHIRKANRQLDKDNRELKRRLAELENPQKDNQLGKKPDLEDFDYDQDQYEIALIEWNDKRKTLEAEQEKQRELERLAKESWNQKVDRYVKAKIRVRNDDFELVESIVQEKLSTTQQNLILAASKTPEQDVFALGKSAKDLDRLAAIEDQAEFIYELGKLHAERGTKRMAKKAPKPETRVNGAAPKARGHEANLRKLEAEAKRTGDRTRIQQYKRKYKLTS